MSKSSFSREGAARLRRARRRQGEVKSAARGPLSSVVMLGHRVHTARARRAHAAGYRTFRVHDLRLSRRRCIVLPPTPGLAIPLSQECLLRFDSEFQPYTDGSALGVVFQSASCVCPGRASGRGRNSWILKNVTFTLDTDPHPRAPTPQAELSSCTATYIVVTSH